MITGCIVVLIAVAFGAYYHAELSASWLRFKLWLQNKVDGSGQ